MSNLSGWELRQVGLCNPPPWAPRSSRDRWWQARAATSRDVPGAGCCSWGSSWTTAFASGCFASVIALRSCYLLCSGMTGMRKWLLILVQGWRNLLGALWAEEVPEMRMLSPKHWSLFVFPAGVLGGSVAAPCQGAGTSSRVRPLPSWAGGSLSDQPPPRAAATSLVH